MAIKGLFSSDASPAHERVQGFAKALVQYEAVNQAPLLSAFGINTNRSLKSTNYEWTEQQKLTGINYVVDNGNNPLASTLRLADTSWVTEHMIFLVISTGEFLFVTGVSGNVVTFVRGYGNNTVRPIVPTATRHIEIQRIGTAFHEGSERPEAVAMRPGQPKFNLTQIFRNSWAVTRTAKMVTNHTGNLVSRNKMDCMMLHTRDIETSMLFGIRARGVQNGQPHRSMDGLYRQIVTNIASPAGGILTERALNTFFQVVFANGIAGKNNTNRIAVCGINAITHINNLVRGSTQYQIGVRETSFGINVTEWITPYGTIKLMPHEVLTNTPGRRSDIIVLHPDAVNVHFMYEGAEEDTTDNGRSNGIDGDIGGLISELTMSVEGELSCGILTGVCGTAATPMPTMVVQPYTPPLNPGC